MDNNIIYLVLQNEDSYACEVHKSSSILDDVNPYYLWVSSPNKDAKLPKYLVQDEFHEIDSEGIFKERYREQWSVDTGEKIVFIAGFTTKDRAEKFATDVEKNGKIWDCEMAICDNEKIIKAAQRRIADLQRDLKILSEEI